MRKLPTVVLAGAFAGWTLVISMVFYNIGWWSADWEVDRHHGTFTPAAADDFADLDFSKVGD